VELAKVSELAKASDLVLVLVLESAWAEGELAQGCSGNRCCCYKTCCNLCCRDHHCHLVDTSRKNWHHPKHSSSKCQQRPLR